MKGNVESRPLVVRKGLFVLSLIVIAVLILDTSLTRASNIFTRSFFNDINLLIFLSIAAVFALGQFVFLRFVKSKIQEIRAKGNSYIILHKVVTAAQFGFTAILVLVAVELLVTSKYSVLALISAVSISYSLGAVMMLILSWYLFSWFRTNRELFMLLYGISAMALVVHLVFTFSYVDYLLSGIATAGRTPFSSPPFFPAGSPKFLLGNIYTVTSITAFITTWIATALLLYNYSRRIGKMQYWTIVSLPLVYFVSQFPAFFLGIFNPLIKSDPLFYGTLLVVIFTISKPAGGVFFGVAFWAAARRISYKTPVRDYLIISAYGYILLFTADQGAVLINASFPPFGLATVSFTSLSSYLILNGIFYSALSVSQDTKLRRQIKKFAAEESKLLDSISSAQFEREVQNKLSAITKYHEDIAKKVGVQPSIDEDEVMDYLDEVIKEKTSSAEDSSTNKNEEKK